MLLFTDFEVQVESGYYVPVLHSYNPQIIDALVSPRLKVC